MSQVLNKPDLENTRAVMDGAGWVFAVQNLPGAYVPGPNIHNQIIDNRWAVTAEEIRELVLRFSDDPELLAIFNSDDK